MDAITIRNLKKTYGKYTVINGLNLTVHKGAIYGFIGKNGAGKSTTQKMVCGLIHETAGELRIFGETIDSDKVRRKIGSLIETPGLYLNMTTWANIYMQAINLGLKKPEAACEEKLALVGLLDAKTKKAKALSLGMKQRLGLAIALLGNPEILVLDEPINGLDPEGIVQFRQVLEDLNKQGITIFISSHILGELAKIATHYGVLRDGVLVEEMTAQELIDKREGYLTIETSRAQEALSLLEGHFAYERAELVAENQIRLYDTIQAAQINRFLLENHFSVSELHLEKQDLEQYFLELMGGY